MLSWEFAVRSGGSAVLIDQPGDGPSTADPGGHVDHLARIVQRRAERTALMRTMIVEMALILGQDRTQVPLTIDQQVIQALTSQRSHEPLRERVRPRRPDRRLDDPHTTGGEHLIERAGELAVTVPDKKP